MGIKNRAVGIVIGLVVLAGCGSTEKKDAKPTEPTTAVVEETTQAKPQGMDENSRDACTLLAKWAKDGRKGDRVGLASEINSKLTDTRYEDLKAAGEGLSRTAPRNMSAFNLAADVFAQSCYDNGWKP